MEATIQHAQFMDRVLKIYAVFVITGISLSYSYCTIFNWPWCIVYRQKKIEHLSWTFRYSPMW